VQNILGILPLAAHFAHESAVTASRVAPERFNILDDTGPERIQMNVTHQLEQVRLLFTQNGFVSVLKQDTVPTLPAVELQCVTGQQPAHEAADGTPSRP
jgi:hypothetical protein